MSSFDDYKIEFDKQASLVSLVCSNFEGYETTQKVEASLIELRELLRTLGITAGKQYVQNKKALEPATMLGPGKLEEIASAARAEGSELLVFDFELTASQLRNIKKLTDMEAIDRSTVILEIFAHHAKTSEARIQVEISRLQYMLPRLQSLWTHFSKQKGGIGMKGAGETEIETDRRIVRDRIAFLKERLKIIDRQMETQRKNRADMIRVALVGYTNVGKSTIMNMLSKSDVFAENKLFATLDTTTRKVVFENTPFLLSDTVGFIRKLPHHLVESFKSTLDEVREADVLLHVVDVSHAQYEDQIGVVNKTLQELKAFDKPIITIFNKMDLYKEKYFDEWVSDEVKQDLLIELKDKWNAITNNQAVFISAIEKQNIEELRMVILHKVRDMYQIRFPYKTVYYS